MAQRFYLAQDGHIVPLISPINITGGVTSPAFSMKEYSHVSIVIGIGVSAAAPGAVTLNACTDANGDGATPLAFDVFKAETSAGTANSDCLGSRIAATASGFVPSANDNIFYVIEFDAQQLPQGYPYLQLAIADASNSVIAAAYAILSGARYASDLSPTVLT